MGTQTRATMPEELEFLAAIERSERGWSQKRKRDGPGDGNDDEEGEFEVEKISKKRKNNGRLEYFVKWKGYATSENTWEPVENLETAQDLVKRFEEEERQKEDAKKGKKDDKTDVKKPDADEALENPPKSGYSKEGAQLEQILGARKDPESGALEFMVKWVDEETPTMELASNINRKNPRDVIAFYEERLRFEDPESEAAEL